MSNEKNDDVFSSERARRKHNRQLSELNRCSCGESDEKCPVHGDDVQSAERAAKKHAARRVSMNAPHSSLAKLARQLDRVRQAGDLVAFDEYEPPRHPATDLVTALQLLKAVATREKRVQMDSYDWQAWSENVEDLLKQFPNLK